MWHGNYAPAFYNMLSVCEFINAFPESIVLVYDEEGYLVGLNTYTASLLNQESDLKSCIGISFREIGSLSPSGTCLQIRTWEGAILRAKGLAHPIVHAGKKLFAWIGSISQEESNDEGTERFSLQEIEARLTILNKLIADLTTEPAVQEGNIQVAARKIAVSVASVLDVDRCSIWLFDESKSHLNCLELYTPSTGTHYSGDQIECKGYPDYFATLEKERLVVADSLTSAPHLSEAVSEQAKQHPDASILDAGILSGGELIGVISIEIFSRKKSWKIEEITFLQAIADSVALSYQNYKRNIAEQELHESRERFERISAATSDGLWEISFTDDYRYISEQMYALWDNLIDPKRFWKSWFRYIDKEDMEVVMLALRNHLHYDKPFDVEFRVNTPKSSKWLQARGKVYRSEVGEPLLMSGSVRDITLRKKAEEKLRTLNQDLEVRIKKRTALLNQLNEDLERSLAREQQFSEMKTKFVTMLSHEFRTPLTVIQSGVGLLEAAVSRSKQLSPEQVERIAGRVSQGVDEMVVLLDAASRLISIQTLLLTTKPERQDIVPVCHQSINFAAQRTERQISLEAPPTLEITIIKEMLTFAMDELLDNAVKYSPGGSPITVRIGLATPLKAFLEVISEGTPIDADEQNRLFELFQRGRNQIEIGSERGLGIGLGIVAMCADAMEGSVFSRSLEHEQKNAFGFYFALVPSILETLDQGKMQ